MNVYFRGKFKVNFGGKFKLLKVKGSFRKPVRIVTQLIQKGLQQEDSPDPERFIALLPEKFGSHFA